MHKFQCNGNMNIYPKNIKLFIISALFLLDPKHTRYSTNTPINFTTENSSLRKRVILNNHRTLHHKKKYDQLLQVLIRHMYCGLCLCK